MDTPEPETFYQAMKRLDREIERDKKMSDRYYTGLLGVIFLGLALAFFLLHIQLSLTHVA